MEPVTERKNCPSADMLVEEKTKEMRSAPYFEPSNQR